MNPYDKLSPLDIAVAISLYQYNVMPSVRAERLYAHFDGYCMDVDDMISLFQGPMAAYAATELPAPTAAVYVQHALEAYGHEAQKRNRLQLAAYREFEARHGQV